MSLIDTHAHLDDARFADDFGAVLRRAAEAGLERIIAVATTAASSHSVIAMAKANAMLRATVGLHPNNVAAEPAGAWDEVVRLSSDPVVVGLGETGLDRHWHDTPFPLQEEFFARHLDLSRQTGLPVVIHCREADADTLKMLRAEFDARGPIKAVMHSFCGNQEMAAACLDMGLFISFAGMLTYKNADDLRATAKTIPLDRLLVETDCPYLAPVPVRGKRNEPAHVAHTARCLADVLGVPLEAVASQTTANALRLFQRETLR
jgi:TatD DNase family protein